MEPQKVEAVENEGTYFLIQKYAGELKRVHREKLQKDNGETVSSFSGHRMLINY
jgi:hypothetical protein